MFPITSVIISGSANIGMLCQMLGIVDEVKGAAYSSTSLDSALYADNYLDTDKVEKLGTSATTIKIEDGKIGASETISQKGVTALISDWNKTYITNEAAFEAMGVDLVRVAASALDEETYTNTILTLGFLFQKEETAQALVALYDECFALAEENASDGSLAGVAASMNGYFSSADSDYTAVLLEAGLSFGLEGFDFKGKTSIKAADNLDVYDTEKYDFDYIVHIRTAAGYANSLTTDTIKAYADSFPLWKYTNGEHQYIVSGAIPVPLRVLYTECIFSNTISKADVDALHQEFIDEFYAAKNFDASEIAFFVDCSTAYANA